MIKIQVGFNEVKVTDDGFVSFKVDNDPADVQITVEVLDTSPKGSKTLILHLEDIIERAGLK